MNRNNSFVGKLMAMILIIGALVTMSVIGRIMYTNYTIDKINEKYNYMETAEYKMYQEVMNEKYNR